MLLLKSKPVTGSFYNEVLLRNIEPVTVKAEAMPLDLFLKEVFSKLPLEYTIRGKTIVISKKALLPVDGPTGRQLEETPCGSACLPVVLRLCSHGGSYALVRRQRTVKEQQGGYTNRPEEGRFTINANPGDPLVVSFIGYQEKEVTVPNTTFPSYHRLKSHLNPNWMKVQITNAYGQTTKRMSIGNIYTVKGEDIARISYT